MADSGRVKTGGDRTTVTLTPSGLGQYINYSGCGRFFRYKYVDKHIVRDRNWFDSSSISSLLSELGLAFEEEQLAALADEASVLVGTEEDDVDVVFDETWTESVMHEGEESSKIVHLWEHANRTQFERLVEDAAALDPGDGPIVLYQPPIAGKIGVWEIGGLADLITLEPTKDGIKSRVLEVKASWHEKTSQQIQAAVYSVLIDSVITDLGFEHDPEVAILNRESDLRETNLSDVPTFDRSSRAVEVRRLLKEDGELHRISQKEFEDVGFRLNQKCDTCSYNGVCFTKAIESKDTALLNITQGDKRRLEKHGIETLDGLSELFERDPDKRPFEYDGLEIEDEDAVRKLESEGGLGERLEGLVQRAQMLRGEIDPSYERFDDVQYLKGSGPGGLPDDDPHPSIDPCCDRGALLRVYLFVQHDNVRDRVSLLGARINGNKIEPRTVERLTDTFAMEKDASRQEEERLLKGFFTDLFQELSAAAEHAGYADDAFFHLYFFARQERENLVEAVRRHPATFGSPAIRDLLGLREAIDQPMTSIVHDELTKRLALRYPGTGLLQTVEQMEAWAGDETHDKRYFRNRHWKVDRGGETIDLQSVFREGIFEGNRPYQERGDHIELLLDSDSDTREDGWYPLYNRYGNSIPLEYLWGVRGKLEEIRDLPEVGAGDAELVPYRFRSASKRDRITSDDVEALAGKLCEALEHVERSIQYKNARIDKDTISIPDLPQFALKEADLADACLEYLDLEYATSRQECYQHYMDPPRKRMQSGESVIFRCTSVVRDEQEEELIIDGEMLYDEFFDSPRRVLDNCGIKGGDGSSSGSWMVMTQLKNRGDDGFEQVHAEYPQYLENGSGATVETFDRENQRIRVSASTYNSAWRRQHPDRDPYITWHRTPTDDWSDIEQGYGSNFTYVSEGELYVLDPYADSWPMRRNHAALQHADTNALYEILNDTYEYGNTAQLEQSFCSQNAVDEFLDEFEDALGIAPKGKQKAFLREVDHAVSVLQGPPGTGKTSFTLAPTVLSRVAAFEKDDESLAGVVTAPSHTAVDESLEDIADRWAEYSEATGNLENLSLVRIISSKDQRGKELSGVKYRHYRTDKDVERVIDLLARYQKDETEHVLLFATPTSLRGIMDRVAKQGPFEFDSAEDLMSVGFSIFDLLTADEASMLDLPSTLLASSFLRNDAQALFIGDHRQMEPVQQHDWEDEDRRTIEENIPFMSALNFMRFLRGDLNELEYASRESPEVGDAIPITRLDRTYRLHRTVADLLTELIYTDDGIRLRSTETDLLDSINPAPDGVETIMDPEYPVVLIIHDEAESQDSNPTEVALLDALIEALPDSTPETVGIVTPHNAQKGRLRELLGDVAMSDTVERFQGGERDTMFITATASDPDYVRGEADFLLNPNRLNVAMSRMKKKLVVIASTSVFEIVPTDAEEYDDTVIWKRLYDQLNVTNPDQSQIWAGPLSDLAGGDIPDGVDGSTSLDVYGIKVSDRES